MYEPKQIRAPAAFLLPSLMRPSRGTRPSSRKPSTTAAIQSALLTVTSMGPKISHSTLELITRHAQEQQLERRGAQGAMFQFPEPHIVLACLLARFISWHTKTPRRQSQSRKSRKSVKQGDNRPTPTHHTYPTTRTAPGEQTEDNKLIKHQPATCQYELEPTGTPDLDTNKQPTLCTPAPAFPE